MTVPSAHDANAPEMEWDELAPGGEISATVVMASGFALQDGQRVRERYRIERVLGEGAMGQVLAVSLLGRGDEQTYALKVVARAVNDGHSDAEHAEAERQARTFAELLRQEAAKQDMVQRHGVPVARLFALVQLDDGSIGMRMELARGRSLESHVDDEKTRTGEPPEAMWSVTVVRKLVSQLRRLHEMPDTGSAFGFVHSDIKPGNVFVDDTDPTDVLVTLLDFGVATAGQALAHDLTTRGGARKTLMLQETGGTLGYAPPYHFAHAPTPLSDVHAALVILYELLTGDVPWDFGATEQISENMFVLEAAMLRGPREVRSVRPSISLDDARTLDEFFKQEFAALHSLADQVSENLYGVGEPKKNTELVAALQRLARDYQMRLDQLRVKLAPSRRPPAHAPLGAMPVIPKAPAVPRFDDFALPPSPWSPSSAPTTLGADSTAGFALTRRKPRLIVMASVPPPARATNQGGARGHDSDAARPWTSRPAVWIGVLLGVPTVAAGVSLLAHWLTAR